MNKDLAVSLVHNAEHVAQLFSSKDRLHNHLGETFKVEKIVPLSGKSAAVIYRKNTGKIAVAKFDYIESNGGRWMYFFPNYDHVEGMRQFLSKDFLQQVEAQNFPMNFEMMVEVKEAK